MATQIDVGQPLHMSIAYLDQNGQPMVKTQTPDSAPSWSQTNPSADTLTQAVDGNSADTVGAAAGDDTINLSTTVGGQTFTASLALTVVAVQPTQTLTSVQIVPGTPTP